MSDGTHRRTAGAVVLALALLSVPVLAAGPTSAQSSSVTVTNTTVTPESPSAGETFIVKATIANAESAGASYDLTNVYVKKPGGGRSDVARDLGELSPGTSTTVEIPVSVAESGWRSLSLQVHGVDQVHGVENFQHPVPVRIGGAGASQISMAATADDLGPSGRTDLRVMVANGLDQAITGVDLEVDSEGLTLPEPTRVASRLVPGNQTTFTLPVRDVEPGEYTVTVDLSYTTESGDRRTVERELSTVVSAVDEPGEIRLRGVEVVPGEGGRLEVRGSAANVGTTDVSSVDVSVQDGETAGPADSSATYFVGNVPASDFSSFTVTAQPTTNGTVTIPLEVSYVVDGVRTNRTVAIDHQVTPQPSPGQNQGGGGGGAGLVTIVGLLFVVGAVVIGWRRYRS